MEGVTSVTLYFLSDLRSNLRVLDLCELLAQTRVNRYLVQQATAGYVKDNCNDKEWPFLALLRSYFLVLVACSRWSHLRDEI